MAKDKVNAKKEKKPVKKTKKPLVKVSPAAFFVRYHAVLFTIGIVGGLAVAIFMLHLVVDQSDPDVEVEPTPPASFDEATIERVQNLTPSTEEPPALEAPSGRIDPFSQ